MRMLTRTLLLTLLSATLPLAASAQLVTQFSGPLNTIPSGRLLCGATNALPGYGLQNISLTIHDANGAVVKTQNFPGVGMFEIVEIEIGPGKSGSHICVSQSNNGVNLTLTYKSSLQTAQASVGSAHSPLTNFSVAGPLEPGSSHKVVCKVASGQGQSVEVEVRDDNGNTVAGPTTFVLNGRGSAEIFTNSFFGRQYSCLGTGLSGLAVQANIESRGPLGDPKAATSGEPGPPVEICEECCEEGDSEASCNE